MYRMVQGLVLCVLALLCAETSADTENADQFLEWFKEKGGESNGLSLAQFPGMGRGVLATEKLRDEDLVLDVPMDMILCRRTAVQQPKKAAYPPPPLSFTPIFLAPAVTLFLVICLLGNNFPTNRYKQVQDDADLVALFLMYERALGEKSNWAPYIKALPTAVPRPIFFSGEELAELQDANLEHSVQNELKMLHNDFETLFEPRRRLFKDLKEDVRNAHNNAESFSWARSLVASRALTLKGEKYLVPFADMFNYQPQGGAKRKHDNGAHFLKYHVLGTSNFQIYADRETEVGGQVFEDYGDNDNDIYLKYHGFVTLENPFDCVQLQLDQLTDANDISGGLRVEITSKMNIPGPPPSCVYNNTLPGPELPQVLRRYLSLKRIGPDGARACLDALNDNHKSRVFEVCLDGELTSLHYADLVQDVKRQLNDNFVSTIEEDWEVLSNIMKGSVAGAKSHLNTHHYNMAVSYRLSKKLILQNLIFQFTRYEREGSQVIAETDSSAASAEASETNPDDEVPHSITTVEGDEHLETLVRNFNKWVDDRQPPFPTQKLVAKVVPGMRIGTMAKEHLAPEDLYISVPTDTNVMNRNSAQKCELLGPVIQDLAKRFSNGDEFHEILFHVLTEKYVKKEKSEWKPYLDIIPDMHEMENPVYYSPVEMDWLTGSHVLPALVSYQDKIERNFGSVTQNLMGEYPLFKDHPEAFNRSTYQWAHCILDSRAIWWGGGRHLVPMLDLVNCAEGPNQARIHATTLDSAGENALTFAAWDFPEGSQVFENYGQPNHIYFLYHGFALQSNTYDCVRWDMTVSDDHIPDSRSTKEQLMQSMTEAGFRGFTQSFCINVHAPKYVTDLAQRRHTGLAMALKFLTFMEGVPLSARKAKQVLRDMAKERLVAYPTTLNEDVVALHEKSADLSFRHKMVLTVVSAEKKMLQDLVEHLEAELFNDAYQKLEL